MASSSPTGANLPGGSLANSLRELKPWRRVMAVRGCGVTALLRGVPKRAGVAAGTGDTPSLQGPRGAATLLATCTLRGSGDTGSPPKTPQQRVALGERVKRRQRKEKRRNFMT